MPKYKLNSIQVLRAIAAALVVLDHSLLSATGSKVSPLPFSGVAYLSGDLGVYLFFVISGFIMYYTSHDLYGQPGAPGVFVRRRLLRIVPLYWFATIAFVAVAALRHRTDVDPSPARLLTSLFFIPYPNFRSGFPEMVPLLGQGWTLNHEMFFYALFTLSLFLPRRLGAPALMVALAALVASALAIHPRSETIAFWCRPHILLFGIGVGLGMLRRRFAEVRISIPYPLAISAVSLMAPLIGYLLLTPGQTPGDLWNYALWPFVTIPVTVCVFGRAGEPSALRRGLEFLGDASYSTYLVHNFVLTITAAVVFHIVHGPSAPVWFVAIGLVGANAVGALTFVVVERPLNRAVGAVLRRLAPERHPVARVETPAATAPVRLPGI